MLVSTSKLGFKTHHLEVSRLLLQKLGISRKLGYYCQWLIPGLSIKRWLLLSAIGVWLTSWGVATLCQQAIPLFTTITTGSIAIALGLVLVGYGQIRAFSSIISAIAPEGDRQLLEHLIARRHLHRSPKIVALGGGTGLSNILRGLKQYSSNLTAIVTVADDGGSSGRLRQEFGVLPPGDIRNCIAALAKEESFLTDLFQYRFRVGEGLKGHSFGNLFLTAMSEITGDLESAIAASSKVLAIKGKVLPATLSDVNLWAELETGELIVGESKITAAKGQINHIGCLPANPPALPAAIKAIKQADCIIIGPGSLYTSIIPNLLVPEIQEAIAQAKVPKIYVCNIMTQPGETEGYSVADHIQAIDKIGGYQLFDTVLVNSSVPSTESLAKYAEENSYPVVLDGDRVSSLGRRVILSDLMKEDKQTKQIRHDFQKLAKVISSIVHFQESLTVSR